MQHVIDLSWSFTALGTRIDAIEELKSQCKKWPVKTSFWCHNGKVKLLHNIFIFIVAFLHEHISFILIMCIWNIDINQSIRSTSFAKFCHSYWKYKLMVSRQKFNIFSLERRFDTFLYKRITILYFLTTKQLSCQYYFTSLQIC